jgi:hypothetical protein
VTALQATVLASVSRQLSLALVAFFLDGIKLDETKMIVKILNYLLSEI